MSQHDFLDSIYREHHAALHRFLTSMLRNSDDARDVAHDTYLKIYRLVRAPELIRDPRAFLFRAAANLANEHLRRGCELSARKPLEQLYTLEDHLDMDKAIEAEELLNRLSEALDELPPKCQRAFLMRHLEERTHADIAAELDVSVSMVEKYMARSNRHCETRLNAHMM